MGDRSQFQVTVASLQPSDKEGFCTKQGGSIKTWKRRWFVLKEKRLYYFKNKTDPECKGWIELEPGTSVKDESLNKKKKNMFSILARGPKGRRTFLMYPDTLPEVQMWIEAIRRNIDAPAGGAAAGVGGIGAHGGAGAAYADTHQHQIPASSSRAKILAAKSSVGFLHEEDSKVVEFWQIWSESIPPREELQTSQSMDYIVAVSADMEKLTWRTAGPQNIFIQKMVDFFWNVGAPESEIDRLNDVGALINPVKIGSWIDMSAKGGMDGGWFFPVDIPLKLAIEAADTGEPSKKVVEWSENNKVVSCFSVGRDMGAAPPRQTEVRVKLPGGDFVSQLNIALSAFAAFGFPALPESAVSCLRMLGLLSSQPPPELVNQLCDLPMVAGHKESIHKFEQSVGQPGPQFVELQYLMKGFGYGVYKEGFDIVFHFLVGEEYAQ